jgi:hypothetical protein
MDSTDKQLLVEAVNILIVDPAATELYQSMALAAGVAARVSIVLTGEAAVLNPLLRLRVNDREAYDKVLELIDRKRQERGLSTLVNREPKGYDKTAYMRQFMDQKRERQRRAAEIENMRRPERDRLVGNARLEFMRLQSLKWKQLRDQMMKRAQDAAGGSLTADARRELVERFWRTVDADLDAKAEAAKKAQLNPSRRVKESDESDSLLEALNLPGR